VIEKQNYHETGLQYKDMSPVFTLEYPYKKLLQNTKHCVD